MTILWGGRPNMHDGYIDPKSDYAQRLLAKRQELDLAVAHGDLSLEKAERLLGQWHEQNRPQ